MFNRPGRKTRFFCPGNSINLTVSARVPRAPWNCGRIRPWVTDKVNHGCATVAALNWSPCAEVSSMRGSPKSRHWQVEEVS